MYYTDRTILAADMLAANAPSFSCFYTRPAPPRAFFPCGPSGKGPGRDHLPAPPRTFPMPVYPLWNGLGNRFPGRIFSGRPHPPAYCLTILPFFCY